MALSSLDPRRLLGLPAVYDLFQEATGSNRVRKRFVERHIASMKSGRVLEAGCGTGTNCTFLPEGIAYVGCDLSPRYIDYAKKRHGARGTFHLARVGEMRALNLEPFDRVLVMAVLHHLSDEEVLVLCDEVKSVLKPGGALLTGDPCYVENQPRLERWITSKDRGQFIRFPEQYQKLLGQRFATVDAEVERVGWPLRQSAVTLIAR